MLHILRVAGIVEALVDSAADKSETTRRAVHKALVDIGRKKHHTVLGICHSYLKKHGKVRKFVEGILKVTVHVMACGHCCMQTCIYMYVDFS